MKGRRAVPLPRHHPKPQCSSFYTTVACIRYEHMSRAIHCPWSVGAGIKIYLTKTLAKQANPWVVKRYLTKTLGKTSKIHDYQQPREWVGFKGFRGWKSSMKFFCRIEDPESFHQIWAWQPKSIGSRPLQIHWFLKAFSWFWLKTLWFPYVFGIGRTLWNP